MMTLLKRDIMSRLSLPLASARTVEEVTRSVLAMLEIHTSLESSYFVVANVRKGVLKVRYAYNCEKSLTVPEGAMVPWAGSLSKRALEDGAFDKKMHAICAELPVARVFGIKTYAGSPIYLDDGTLHGMLCAASASVKSITPEAKQALTLFGKVISQQVQREMIFKAVADNMKLTMGSLI